MHSGGREASSCRSLGLARLPLLLPNHGQVLPRRVPRVELPDRAQLRRQVVLVLPEGGLAVLVRDECGDLRHRATPAHSPGPLLRLFLDPARAAGAVNALVERSPDHGVDQLVHETVLVLPEPTTVGSVEVGDVLQVTVIVLLTDGAIQGMVDQQQLHVPLASTLDQPGVGQDRHTRHDGGCARHNYVLSPRQLNHAHTAVSSDAKGRVVTELGHDNTSTEAHFDQRLLVGLDLDGLVVDKHQSLRLRLGTKLPVAGFIEERFATLVVSDGLLTSSLSERTGREARDAHSYPPHSSCLFLSVRN
eukprot:Hpha_TRINITY_DN15915_c5_g1::TRINITY_DN15915_c5_g1_i1::g.73245::m.73245